MIRPVYPNTVTDNGRHAWLCACAFHALDTRYSGPTNHHGFAISEHTAVVELMITAVDDSLFLAGFP